MTDRGMICVCGHARPELAKVCPECGATFAPRCGSCGAELTPAAKFCAECGTRQRGGVADDAVRPAPHTPKHLASRSGPPCTARSAGLAKGSNSRSDFLCSCGAPGRGWTSRSPRPDRVWTCWVLGDADRARRFTGEALQMAERFGTDRNVVYALLACGIASCLGLRWDEGGGLFERARQRIATTGAGREWSMLVDGDQALCRAGMGDRDGGLELARRGVEQANANALYWPRVMQGALAARVLRMVGGVQHQDELEARVVEAIELIQHCDMTGMLPLALLERAGLARLRGDADGMARDLVEARRLFAQMGATGWDDYARSIEA